MKAAIEWIQKTVKQLEHMSSIRKPGWPGNKLSKSLHQILPVLEVGEKVDRKTSIELMDEIRFFLVDKDKRDDDFIKTWVQIKNFLESLPDKPEKEKSNE